MLFKCDKQWIAKLFKGKMLLLVFFSILLASCATSQTADSTLPAINPVPIYNPVLQNQPIVQTEELPQYDPSPKYSAPKKATPKKKKKKPVAKKKKSSKKKGVVKSKKSSKKAVKNRVTSKRKVTPRKAARTTTASQPDRKVAESSSPMDNLGVMGEYQLGEGLTLTALPISKGQLSVKIEGSRIDSVVPCKFSGIGQLNNGTATITDKSNNRLNFSFSGNAVNVQGDTLNESCGGEYTQK
jgi:hypothetical protein